LRISFFIIKNLSGKREESQQRQNKKKSCVFVFTTGSIFYKISNKKDEKKSLYLHDNFLPG